MNELTRAIEEADSLFSGGNAANPIMKYIASAESNYGNYNPETALSYGPFQIDPIRYYDIAQNPKDENSDLNETKPPTKSRKQRFIDHQKKNWVEKY